MAGFKRTGSSSSGTGSAKKSGINFNYRPRTAEEMHRRAHQSAGNKEGFVLQDIQTFTPADNENKIRILPPTWDDAQHYGMEIFVHYGVGGDNSAYICPTKARGEACPVCEARLDLDRQGDDEGAKALLPRKRVAMWIIDRSEEAKGPLLWFAPWTLDQEIAKQSIDEDKKTLPLDDPENGYDVTFSRDSQGKNAPPKYTGVKVARKPSPVSDDDDDANKILEYISEHPIPECLVFHDYATIAASFQGAPAPKSEETAPARGKPASAKPSFGKKAVEKEEPAAEEGEELPSWEDVHAMDEEEVTKLAEDAEIDFSGEEFEDLESFCDWLCAQLSIEPPEPEKPVKPAGKPVIGKPSIGGKKPAAAAEAKPSGSWKQKLDKFKTSSK